MRALDLHILTMLHCFLCYLIVKVATIRTHISPPSFDPSIPVTCSTVLNRFEPVSLLSLTKIVTQLKPSSCPTDIVPPRLFKKVWETIGLNVQKIINSSVRDQTGKAQEQGVNIQKNINLFINSTQRNNIQSIFVQVQK